MIFAAIIALLFFSVCAIVYNTAGISVLWFLIPAAIVALQVVCNVCVFPVIRYARWRYAVTDDEIDIVRGLFVVERTIVPIVKVQFTDTKHGPILRAFGLASVTVVTAGGEQSIPGLPFADAEALRDRVTELAKQLQEGV
jgi:membrane protein YdbS with pleckstrin-like domain